MQTRILPSLLAADFGNLERDVRKAESAGADALHLDIMDGHFVPNLSFGPDVVSMARRCSTLPLSVHLMIEHPDRYLERFIAAGASLVLIHIEAPCDVSEALRRIRELKIPAGITLNPGTPAESIWPVLDQVDQVLCMTVHPGYGGQSFLPDVLPKIRRVRQAADAQGRVDLSIMVDGGIDTATAVECARHGADSFVAGTSLFRATDMKAAVHTLREKIAECRAE